MVSKYSYIPIWSSQSYFNQINCLSFLSFTLYYVLFECSGKSGGIEMRHRGD